MKKVISFSVFDNSKNALRPGYYWQHLRHSIWGYLSLFPDWEIWLYHDKSLYNNYYGGAILNLRDMGLIKLIYIGEEKAICKAMLRRLEPLFDSEVEYVLCRDVDHSPTIRERKMNEQFMSSGKALHCIQDNPSHSVPMLGGLVGFSTIEFRKLFKEKSLNELLKIYGWNDSMLTEHGTDQHFMNRKLWPILKDVSCLHSVRKGGMGNDIKNSLFLPRVEPTEVIDTCIPFMGTARCDYEKWYKELRRIGNKKNALCIEQAEGKAFVKDGFSHMNLETACINKRRVVLAVDGNINYFFFMPIVSMLWQHYIGYCPVIMIVGSFKEWMGDSQRRLALEESRKIGAEIYFIPNVKGYQTSSISQLSRLYVSCLPMYHDLMYLVTSDMDMLPLNREWFNKQDMNKKVHLDYSNVYNHTQYPLCYVGCNVLTWREIMKPVNPTNMIDSIQYQLERDKLKEETDGMKIWCYDEKMFGEKIKVWSGYKQDCQMFDRCGCPPVDRIDRSCWPESFDISKMVDCHSVRPGHTSPNWEKVLSVIQQIMNKEHIEWAQKYRWDFCLKGK